MFNYTVTTAARDSSRWVLQHQAPTSFAFAAKNDADAISEFRRYLARTPFFDQAIAVLARVEYSIDLAKTYKLELAKAHCVVTTRYAQPGKHAVWLGACWIFDHGPPVLVGTRPSKKDFRFYV